MSAVQINFKSASQAGGTGGDAVQTAEYTSIATALEGIDTTGSFLTVADGVGRSGSLPAAAYSVDSIASIVVISAVTFGTVPED